MSDTKIRVGITQGDINGIGYEVIIKSLLDPRICELCTPVIYGSAKAAGFYRRTIADAENFSYNIITKASDAHPRRVNLVDCTAGDLRIEPGRMTAEAGQASIAALHAAAADLKAGLIDVVVTAPICKENVHEAGFDFTGHTEFFAAEFGGEPLMMMCSDLLKVGLVTIHVPLAEVAPSVTEAKIVSALHGLRSSLIQDFSIHEPKIAVLALNPHAGDGGVIGGEEQQIITPAIQTAFSEGVLAFGPFLLTASLRPEHLPGTMRFWPCITIRTGPLQSAVGRWGQLYGRVADRQNQPCPRCRVRYCRTGQSQRSGNA